MASFLEFVIADSTNSSDWLTRVAFRTLGNDLSCFRAIDWISFWTGVNFIRGMTDRSPMILDRTLQNAMQQATDAPVDAVKAGQMVEAPKNHQKGPDPLTHAEEIAEAMVSGSDSDRGEPSWSVMGRAGQEDAFAIVLQRAHLLRDEWGWTPQSVRPYIDYAAPIVHDHPYERVIELFRFPGGYNGDDAKGLVQTLKFDHPGRRFIRLIYLTASLDSAQNFLGDQAWKLHCDMTWDSSLEDATEDRGNDFSKDSKGAQYDGVLILHHGPDHPMGVAALIWGDPKNFDEHAKEWESKYPYSPTVLAALANKYKSLGKMDDCERCLNLYLNVSTDFWAYEELAKIYEAKGDRKDQIKMLEHCLDLPDSGLEGTRIQIQLTNLYANDYDFDTAWKHVQAAAQSQAAWAMLRASEIAEIRGDLENSEQWMKDVANHYEGNCMFDWYLWCKRNARGDLAAARAGAVAWISDSTSRRTEAFVRRCAMFHWMEGHPEAAMMELKNAMKISPTVRTGMEVALCAHALHQDDKAREYYSQAAALSIPEGINAETRGFWVSELAIAKLISDAASRPDGLPDQADIDKQLETLDLFSHDFQFMNYIVGRYYELRGKPDIAVTYYKKAISLVEFDLSEATIASMALREKGIDPVAIRADVINKLKTKHLEMNEATRQAPAAPR
jgi:tetratricopeptide (TPR) repeat protein